MNETAEIQPPRHWRPIFIALLAAGSLAIGLVIATWAVEGVPPAERAATSLVMPVGVVWLFFFAATVWSLVSRMRLASLLFFALFAMLSVTCNGSFAAGSMSSLEWPIKDAVIEGEPLRAVVVLGGGISLRADGKPELGMDGQRIMTAAQLWHAGKTKAILCMGSEAGKHEQSARRARIVLMSVGVPAEVIYDVPGANTTQEISHLKEFLASPPDDFPESGRLALVTSAFHMPRAMRIVESKQLELTPLPCCYRTGAKRDFSPRQLVPAASAGATFAMAFKERLARLISR